MNARTKKIHEVSERFNTMGFLSGLCRLCRETRLAGLRTVGVRGRVNLGKLGPLLFWEVDWSSLVSRSTPLLFGNNASDLISDLIASAMTSEMIITRMRLVQPLEEILTAVPDMPVANYYGTHVVRNKLTALQENVVCKRLRLISLGNN